MIKTLTTEHPRLFIDSNRIAELKELSKKDSHLEQLQAGLLRRANRLIGEETVPFKIVGPRMLKNCQEVHSRVETLALSYLLTNDQKYADRAKTELFAAAEFPHWNKDHFLDTAELITAFAIGYDWLFHALPAADLKKIKDVMIQKGINIGLELHKENIWWAGHKFNWNQVCNGGLIMGALAVAEDEPKLCDDVFEATSKFLQIAFNSYGKDGGWEGGPDYWQYTTWYSVLLVDNLKRITGNDFGLSKTKGFDQTGLFPIYMSGANDKMFNFADADENYNPLPVLFWLGKEFKLDACINENHRLLKNAVVKGAEIDAFNLIWYAPKKDDAKALPTSKVFTGVNVGSMRGEWSNPKTTFIGFKGGHNQADHAHLDIGSFVLDMAGERWASDLGRDSYDLPNYFNLTEGGGRWDYFRLNTKSHNTLVLNNDIQRAAAKAPVTEMNSGAGSAKAKIDLTEAYQPHASVIRSIELLKDDNVEIVDEITWAGDKKQFKWQILTDAAISIQDKKAVLTKNNKSVTLEILEPKNLGFKAESTKQPEPEMANDGYQLLVLDGVESGGKTTVRVKITKS